jgi:SMI1 / KNR4 family (SUKH-1)
MWLFDIFRKKRDDSYYYGSKKIISHHKFSTIEEIIDFLFQNQTELGVELYNKATDDEIKVFEQSKVHLPDDIKKFYKFCNGFYANDDMFRLIPLEEIVENAEDGYISNKNSFYIGEYMIYSGTWSININPNDKNDYTIFEDLTDERNVLTKSFVEFLEKYINGGVYEGLYVWIEENKTI